MGIETGSGSMEAEAAKFNLQQEAEARAKQLEGTTREQALADLEGLKKSVDNSMGLPEKLVGLEPGESLTPEFVNILEASVAKGLGVEDGTVKFVMDRAKIPEEQRAQLLEGIKDRLESKASQPKPVAAMETGGTEIPKTPEVQGRTSVTLENGTTGNVGDIVQVLDINEKPTQVKVLSFDENGGKEKGGSVQVEDFDATGKSAGGRGGNVELILKGARVIKA